MGWANSTVIGQSSLVANQSYGEQPDLSGAIQRFARSYPMRRFYPNGYVHTDGLADRGDWVERDLICIIKPSGRSFGETTRHGSAGEWVEGELLLYYNVGQNDGFMLEMSEGNGFADVIQYSDRWWCVRDLTHIESGFDQLIGKARIEVCVLPVHTDSDETTGQMLIGHYQLQ